MHAVVGSVVYMHTFWWENKGISYQDACTRGDEIVSLHQMVALKKEPQNLLVKKKRGSFNIQITQEHRKFKEDISLSFRCWPEADPALITGRGPNIFRSKFTK